MLGSNDQASRTRYVNNLSILKKAMLTLFTHIRVGYRNLKPGGNGCRAFYVCVHILLIQSPIDGHLGRFYLLDIVNNAVMNISVKISVWV